MARLRTGSKPIAVNHFGQLKILRDMPRAGVNWAEASNCLKVKVESPMNLALRGSQPVALAITLSLLALLSLNTHAQSCQTSSEFEPAVKTAITTAAQRYFDMVVKGDTASLQQNVIPSLASNFGAMETLVKDSQKDVAGTQASIKSSFLLDASGAAPIPNAEFYCGVFGKNGQTANSAAFYLNNLPPGKYAVVLLDATSSRGRMMVSEILQQAGADWKLADLYIKPAQVVGHDSEWFLAKAREYKTKGQMHNAWFFYEEARSLISPVPFMSTLATDKLFDESQNLQPTDLPVGGKTVDLPAGAVTYKLTAVFPQVVDKDLDLIVKYQSANVANTNQAYQDNVAVMKALLQKYPEVRDAFSAVVARAVDPSGKDYGTLLAMKDIK
jgi:hypothetical protein